MRNKDVTLKLLKNNPDLAAQVNAQEPEKPPHTIDILVPSRGINPSSFTFSFAQLVVFSCMTLVNRGLVNLKFTRRSGTYIDVNRCDLVKQSLADPDVTHVLWLDDDMEVPRDALFQLLQRDLPIVGANYSRRRLPLDFVAIKDVGGVDVPGIKCATNADSTGVEEVDAIGLGCALIRRDVFHAVEYPWFDTHYDRARHRWVGEDVDFCLRAKAAGFPSYVDHDLSHHVTHIGEFPFKLSDTRAAKGAIKAMEDAALADGE